jgi:hypothetical protein
MIIFYNRFDKTKEPINRTNKHTSRLEAAKFFAEIKKMSLKDFLKVFTVSIIK